MARIPLDAAGYRAAGGVRFPGVLFAVLRRRAASAIIFSAVPFTLWHGVTVTRTVASTNLTDPTLTTLGTLSVLAQCLSAR
jgi:hypothetical protein